MAEIARVTVCLRIIGDTLDPDEITRLLAIEPTGYARKGDMRRTASGRAVVAPSGSWRLEAGIPGDLNTQLARLLAKLPNDLLLWNELSRH